MVETYHTIGFSIGSFYIEADGNNITAGICIPVSLGENFYGETGFCTEVSYDFKSKNFDTYQGLYAEGGWNVEISNVATFYTSFGICSPTLTSNSGILLIMIVIIFYVIQIYLLLSEIFFS